MSFNKTFQAGSKAVVLNDAMKWLDTQQTEAQKRGSSIYHRSPSIGTPRLDGYDKDQNEVWTLNISLLNK